MRAFVLTFVVVASCAEAPWRLPIPTGDASAAELVVRPAGRRTYELRVQQRVSFHRRGPGPGAGNADLRFDIRLTREDAQGADGGRVRLVFDEIASRSRGPLSAVAARAIEALQGASATYDVSSRGAIRGFSFEGPAPARTLADLLGKAFLRMSPLFAAGPKGVGARWGETSSVPLDLGEGATLETSFTGSYTAQGSTTLDARPCVLVDVDLRISGKGPAPGAREGAVNASGTGRGGVCVDPATGVVRAGILDLNLRTAVGARPARGARLVHIEQHTHLRIEAKEKAVSG